FSHQRLLEEAARLGLGAEVRLGTAERLPFPDQSADAVVASLVLCTVRDPAAALREVRRMLRPGGRFVFIEHVGGEPGSRTHRAQRLVKPLWRVLGDGCHPDRDTEAAIREAGFARV